MKLFLDSAKIDEIKTLFEMGICNGVTTNPNLIKSAVENEKLKYKKINIENYISNICQTVGVGGDVSLEVISIEANQMIEEAKILFNKFNHIANNVVIKIPVNTFFKGKNENNFEGLKAIKKLSIINIPVNATIIMSPEQAFLAAKAGAKYVSPFMARLDDYIRDKININYQPNDFYDSEKTKKIILNKFDHFVKNETLDEKNISQIYNDNQYEILINDSTDCRIYDGIDLTKVIIEIFSKYNFGCEVLAASLRNKIQVREVLKVGVDAITVPFDLLSDMISHSRTENVLKFFCNNVAKEYETFFTTNKI